ADALDLVAGAVDRFDLARDPRYAWPLLNVGARACAAVAAAAARDRAAAERADDLLGQLRALARKLDCTGPVMQASRLIFEAQTGADPAGAAGGQPPARWGAAAAACERLPPPLDLPAAPLPAAPAAPAARGRGRA